MTYLIAILAVWRLTHMIVNESGPYSVFIKLRYFINKRGWEFIDINCFNCMSVWLAIPVGFILGGNTLLNILALSAVAIFLELTYDRLDF